MTEAAPLLGLVVVNLAAGGWFLARVEHLRRTRLLPVSARGRRPVRVPSRLD